MMSQGQLPQELVVGIAAAVKTAASVNPLMESAFIAFSTTGLQLHTNDRQAMIETIGADLPSEAVAAVKSLGVRSVPVITTTAEACESAWEYDQVNRAFTTALNDGGINVALAAGDRDGLKSALTTLLESL
jgi:hypothetical protein